MTHGGSGDFHVQRTRTMNGPSIVGCSRVSLTSYLHTYLGFLSVRSADVSKLEHEGCGTFARVLKECLESRAGSRRVFTYLWWRRGTYTDSPTPVVLCGIVDGIAAE